MNGYARRRDAARYVNAFHLLAASLTCDVWFDYVPSKANLADLPSRGDYALLQAMGGEWVNVRLPPAADWAAPLEYWATVMQ